VFGVFQSNQTYLNDEILIKIVDIKFEAICIYHER
jgi:hypothetical protein